MASEEVLYVKGGRPLSGEAEVQGSKNAALPMLAASLLVTEGQTVLHRVPPVKDVLVAMELLRRLGAKVDYDISAETVVIDACDVVEFRLPEALTSRLRASLLFIGPLLARFRRAWISEVGGCTIGSRPTDYHYRGFARLGACVEGVAGGGIDVVAEELIGASMYCDLPARVEGAGTRRVHIAGVEGLVGAEHTVMYDRLDAGLLMMAGAITGGDIALKGVVREHLHVFDAKLQQMGVEIVAEGACIRLKGPEELSPINVVTTFYPGFPTDLQPGMMALACIASGDSYIRETVFEDRLGHLKNLRAFGARVSPEKDRLVIVHGPARLKRAQVKAMDIRAGAACVLAGLVAEGCTGIHDLYQLDRGHAHIERRLRGLGAELERL